MSLILTSILPFSRRRPQMSGQRVEKAKRQALKYDAEYWRYLKEKEATEQEASLCRQGEALAAAILV